nr:uncharacterized protein LOC104647493 [Solanum lycopersicum]
MHYRQPALGRLPLHLQGQNTIIFDELRRAESKLNRPDIEKTKFTEWFKANKEYPDARDLTYYDFPTLTAHSRFYIPLDVTPESRCDIKQGIQLEDLLKKTCLIIWDEAPMENKYCFEALDKSLRGINLDRYENSCDSPFGGLITVYGGDFRQILPVIPKGTRDHIVDAPLYSSNLWPYFSIYELKENMRLNCGRVMGSEAERFATIDKWLLQIGDGSVYDDKKMELMNLSLDISIAPSHNQVESIVDAVDPSLLQKYNDLTYLKERAILTPKMKWFMI